MAPVTSATLPASENRLGTGTEGVDASGMGGQGGGVGEQEATEVGAMIVGRLLCLPKAEMAAYGSHVQLSLGIGPGHRGSDGGSRREIDATTLGSNEWRTRGRDASARS